MKRLIALALLVVTLIFSHAINISFAATLNESYPVADIDNDGNITPLGDGIILLRYLFGYRDDSLVNSNIVSESCNRCSAEQIQTYLATTIEAQAFDCDANGITGPLTDGLLLIRHLLGFTGDALINDVIGMGAQNTTAESISSCLNALTIIVPQDTTPPIITLNGDNPLTIIVGSAYVVQVLRSSNRVLFLPFRIPRSILKGKLSG